VNLKPLGDRVLIDPERAPDRTESGLYLSEDVKPEMTGTVIAVGQPRHPRKEEAEALAEELLGEHVDDKDDTLGVFKVDVVSRAAELLRDLVRREPCVKVGERVVVSWAGGQNLTVDEGEPDMQRYIVISEEQILAVVED
jgi:co-chaperonin GroES (HSP10)